MKNYVITILGNDKSVEAAERCITSAEVTGMTVEKFSAITPQNSNLEALIAEKKINKEGLYEKYSRPENCVAAFLSHFHLWEMCVRDNEEYTIFEHDAFVLDPIPNFINYEGCINLGKPSYGRWNDPLKLGVNPLTSKAYFPGAHAYRLKPAAARLFIQEARMMAKPTDVFLNIHVFPFLEEYYPWPVEAYDSFTTIQNINGIQAKHNYKRLGDKYEIL
jgi:GR25 family glycosyltransferase involved in LPS biosynthesis